VLLPVFVLLVSSAPMLHYWTSRLL
jgi:hypothetical protein